MVDKTTGKIPEINKDNFEVELNNSQNNTQVNYEDNDKDKNYIVHFKDTGHKYLVDKDGNIISQSNEEKISEEYIIENGVLNEKYSIDGWGTDWSNGKPENPGSGYWSHVTNGIELWGIDASMSNGRSGMYFEPTINFDNISKFEADIILGSNSNGLTNTTYLGVQLDEITKDDKFDIRETTIDTTSSGTEYNVVVNTSDISGNGYIKLYLMHGSEKYDMTVISLIKNLKIYYSN